MNIEFYLTALNDKLRELEGLVITRSIQQEIDINLGIKEHQDTNLIETLEEIAKKIIFFR